MSEKSSILCYACRKISKVIQLLMLTMEVEMISSWKKKGVLTIWSIRLAIMIMAASGCNPLADLPSSTTPGMKVEKEPSNLFSLRSESEDGILVEARSFATGYRPGDEFTFFLDVHNGSPGPWQADFCLVLVDREGVVATLIEDSFSLQPGEGFGTMLVAEYPANIREGAYGLALVIPERMASTSTVYLGVDQNQTAGPFAHPYCP
jgi:hypothetical protein